MDSLCLLQNMKGVGFMFVIDVVVLLEMGLQVQNIEEPHMKVCGKGEGYRLIDADPGRSYDNKHIFMRSPRVDSEPVLGKELKKTILVGHDIGAPMPVAEKHEDDPLPILGEKNIRTPICCLIREGGNGKTKLIDCISRGNIHEGEVGVCAQHMLGKKLYKTE